MDHYMIDCFRTGVCSAAVRRHRHHSGYTFSPNRDAGCVSRHRSPDARRRYSGETSIPSNHSHVRAVTRAALHHYVDSRMWEDELTLSVRVHRGWDKGDQFHVSVAIA